MYYHYCLHKFKWTPKQYRKLSKEDKALVIASINIKIEQEQEEQKKVEREAKKK